MTDLQKWNESKLKNLAVEFKDGNGAVLVGAGASIACGYPGWDKFLKLIASRLPAERLKSLRSRIPRTRLDEMAQSLGDTEYARVFRETFEPRSEASSIPKWIGDLFDLNPRVMITTNYTLELQQAARLHPTEPLGTEPRGVSWHESGRVAEALRRSGGRLGLVYLHGRCDESPLLRMDQQNHEWSEVILGEKSYDYAYVSPGSIKGVLTTLFGSYTLLVVGASLTDDDVTEVFRKVKAIAGKCPPPHYVMLPIRPEETPINIAADLKNRYGLVPIFYEARIQDDMEDHSALQVLLADLNVRVNVAAPNRLPRLPVDEPRSGAYPPAPRFVHSLLRAEEFQNRPFYRKPLDDFIDRDEGGVLALVGIGGAGKTALVIDAIDSHLAGGGQPPLDGLFVWSFYDEPDPAKFSSSLAEYVLGGRVLSEWSEESGFDELKEALDPKSRLLIVLDGLEKLQAQRPDDRRNHGQIESQLIRELLLWIVDEGGGVRAIVTTRFQLPDIPVKCASKRVQILDVDFLTRSQAQALLRERGTKGSNAELDTILDHFGAHALTIDHLGSVISLRLDGEAIRFRELVEEPITRYEAGASGAKLKHVLAAYDGYLREQEPEVADVFDRVAIFSRPVELELLASVFLKPERAKRAGLLAGKSEEDLWIYVNRLVELRLLREERIGGQIAYTIHPLVRDLTFDRLGPSRGPLAGAAREEIEGSLRLLERPGALPTDEYTLDLVEDVIGFCIDEGELQHAFDLYWRRLGHYEHLASQVSAYTRGERLTYKLAVSTEGDVRFSPADRYLIIGDLALFLWDLGRLEEALPWFRTVTAVETWVEHVSKRSLTTSFQNRCLAESDAGRLPSAVRSAERACTMADEVNDDQITRKSHYVLARALHAVGEFDRAFENSAKSRSFQNQADGDRRVLYSMPAFDFQIALLRHGQVEEALVQIGLAKEIHERNGWQRAIAHSYLAHAEALRVSRRPDEAEVQLHRALEWARTSRRVETLLWFRVFKARLLRDLDQIDEALKVAADGRRTADTSGFGLFRIDFRNILADLELRRKNAVQARGLALRALDLAQDPECNYFWGRLDAHEVLGSAQRECGRLDQAHHHDCQATALRGQIHLTDEMLDPLLH